MKNLFKFSTLLFVMILSSCTKDDNLLCDASQDLGLIQLHETSRNFFDYDQFREIKMTNSSGKEMCLEIINITDELNHNSVEHCELPCSENRKERVTTSYRREKLGYDLVGDVVFMSRIGIVGLRVVLEKKIDLSLGQEVGEDNILIFPLITSSNNRGFAVGDREIFAMTIWDNHGNKGGEEVLFKHDQIKFRTRWYDDVFEGPESKEGLKIYLRKGLGIVAMTSSSPELIYLKGLQ